MSRSDGRQDNELRELKLTRGFIGTAKSSVLVEWGRTRVIVTASVENRVPPFLVNTGRGWVSAEYSMLPGSTQTRKARDGRRAGHVDGRTIEIQRLIGRSLRSVVDMKRLGPRTIWIDCDVIEADGGTRTASITGAWVVLSDVLRQLLDEKIIKRAPLRGGVAAVSAGIVDGRPVLDLCYEEDSSAEGDFNFVLSHEGGIIEVQGCGEQRPIEREHYEACFTLAENGLSSIAAIQNAALNGD